MKTLTASEQFALIKLANTLPKGDEKRREVLSLLSDNRKEAAEKKANADFASWVLSTTEGNPIPASEVESFVKGIGAPIFTSGVKMPKPRFRKGKRYCVKAEKHKGKFPDPMFEDGTPTTYKALDRMFGVVIDEGGGKKGDDLTMKMQNGKVVIFPQVQEQYRNVGIGAATDYSKIEGFGPVEVIYKANPSRKPPEEQQQIAAEYIARGAEKGQKRSLNYYSGYVSAGGTGKNGFYMRVMSQQRYSGDPCDQFFGFRSFNPTEGQVLYIGKRGQRPKGWEAELESLRAGAESA
jgi:hypothetical protein